MKKDKGNGGLLNQKRFEKWEKERKHWLRGLTMQEAVRLEEKLLRSALIREWRDNFPEDKPVCLKLGLKRKKK
ncbi:MAG: hypothetical protein JXM79_22450 [Sedimentisphaerales bacterium]|nr:hypothetical protein [Sedimentisphaerales bacterium]